MSVAAASKLLFEGSDWSFKTMERSYNAIEEIALGDLGLDIYRNQIEIISAEQMLDAYASIGMPLMYRHWSFGKRFVQDENLYRKGLTGLAYEIVINSNPCISYNMEENSMALQTLVMAHAAFGHNHFFKNNYLFRQWTDADGILEYLQFARNYIAKCEERYGLDAVEEILDSAHALMDQGVFRYSRRPKPTKAERQRRRSEREAYEERTFNDLWRTVPGVSKSPQRHHTALDEEADDERNKLPEENLLYFLEKQSPKLKGWQREILRIVRHLGQYFYPQKQTKVMNEGCATFVHYTICNLLFDRGLIDEGAIMEILHNHSNVIFQPDFDDRRFSGLNPYTLGFSMMDDIRRICVEPEPEDYEWFPEIAGTGDWQGVLKHAWANYRDESFILQYLSPRLIRKRKLFRLQDKSDAPHYLVTDIHDERGYKVIRQALAKSYDLANIEPDIQVVDAALKGDRCLKLEHRIHNGIPLDEKTRDEVLKHVARLWGYKVRLEGIDQETGERRYQCKAGSDES